MKKKKNKPRRGRLEKFLDRHNHKMELLRTIGNLVGGIAGSLAVLRILNII